MKVSRASARWSRFKVGAVLAASSSVLLLAGCSPRAAFFESLLGIGNHTYGPLPYSEVLASIKASMEKGQISQGCATAREQLFFPATSAGEGRVNKKIFKMYFAGGMCAPKGRMHFPKEDPDNPGKDSAWESDDRNLIFRHGKSVTRDDVMREDFTEGERGMFSAENPYDTNTFAYTKEQGALPGATFE